MKFHTINLLQWINNCITYKIIQFQFFLANCIKREHQFTADESWDLINTYRYPKITIQSTCKILNQRANKKRVDRSRVRFQLKRINLILELIRFYNKLCSYFWNYVIDSK